MTDPQPSPQYAPARLLVDAHQDLAWNMLTFGRDYTLAAAETRRRESGGLAPAHNGDTLLGWPDYQRGRVGLIFATLFAAPERRALGDWDRLTYRDAEQAHRLYRAQVDAYHRLADSHPGRFRLVETLPGLEAVLAPWLQASPGEHPLGLVILMENAEGVRSPQELEQWREWGVRIIGPAWAGTRFCGGTREPGPLTKEGYALLEAMAGLGFILDISHMDEQAALQALDIYPGTVIASHANARALLKGSESNRHLTDRVIQALLERDGVIGVIPTNGFLKADWKDGGGREVVPLDLAAAQIDYLCQMAGDACHVGIGSDFDGGFGWQSVPAEIDTVADLQKLGPLLSARGFQAADLDAIFHGNWLGVLRRSLLE
jgi:membrane dipeptidase